MRVVINLLALRAYVDRLKLICTLSNRLEHLTLLTDHLPADLPIELASYSKLSVVELGSSKFSKRAASWIDEATRRTRIDVVHDTFGFLAPFFQRHGADATRPYRLLTTLYTSNWDWFQHVRRVEFDISWKYASQRVRTLWRERRICPSADQVMVLGPGHEQTISAAHGVPLERISWCPAEVDTDFYCPSPGQYAPPPALTFSGALCRNKGIDVLLDAAQILKEADTQFVLKMIGRVLPWEQSWFRGACRERQLDNHLIQYGHCRPAELVQHYRQSLLFVFPSRFEGSPRAVREALSCGLPCIVSDIPGHRGLDPTGRFLRFVSDWDPNSWADEIKLALGESLSEHRQRRTEGRRHMQQNHSFEAVADRWAELYERLCRSAPWPALIH